MDERRAPDAPEGRPSSWRNEPHAHLTAAYDQPCPDCRRNTLTAVTVHIQTSKGLSEAGGWAYCLDEACEALPYPAMEFAHG
ncbi:hypothetical protein [Streptomyces sp. AMCC400023]|uniref:hypothetical protein n=1 Tax=Streptomyces sp. AMCC400023 TaxID=2056258 RepID=UPI001F2A69B5|nr:hypothetical protein [Streptomyces sp. AMCC400023]UJV42975.1 hypothetical protein CVT30_26825 [Streptomyces sp. AMCC400023]